MPLQWATAQTNLGRALSRLGEWESGTKRLEQAVEVHRAALQERTRERVPLGWARTQNDLGNALFRLGERESGTQRLEEALAAYRAALQELTRERVPLQWATAQDDLGRALQTLGERESATERLEEATEAYRAPVEVFESAGLSSYGGMSVRHTRENLERAHALLDERRQGEAAAGQ